MRRSKLRPGANVGRWATAYVCVALTAVASSVLQAAAPSSVTSAAHEAAVAAEDVAILKALAPLQLNRAQLAQLLPVLRGVQERLAEFETREAEKLAAMRGSLDQARRDLLASKGSGSRAQEQYAASQSASAQRRAGLRAELAVSLRRALDTILTPDQLAQLAIAGQGVIQAQRTAGGGGGAGGPGGRGRGNVQAEGGMSGRLDRIRSMSPAEFQQNMSRMSARFGGESSQQFQQYVAFLNSVRTMSHSQYQVQRDQLAARALPGSALPGGSAAGSSADAANAFVDRYLLSSRAPVVVADRLSIP